MSHSQGFTTLCRECLSVAPTMVRRCPSCGSPRLIAHPELGSLSIAHLDCDAFYAAIEKRDNPELQDRPLIVGGGRRGVVSTACYIARSFGVRSAMPMFQALDACPDAVVIRPDMNKYANVAKQIRTMMLELTPLVEPLSIDEAFLDLSGTDRLHRARPAFVLAKLANRIQSEIGVSVSIGLSYCKFLAKIASDLDKPSGFAVIGKAQAKDFLAEQPVGLIWGVGKVAQGRLAADGFRLIGDLQKAELSGLMRRYGADGARLWRLSRGVDDRVVDPVRETKSVSAETTFETDLADLESLARIVYALCEKVSARLIAKELAGRSVTLKLKTTDFQIRTRARSLNEPTQLVARLFEAARDMLVKEAKGPRYRLIGVGVSELAPGDVADQGDLADSSRAKQKAHQTAVNDIRARFGNDAVVRGIVFNRPPNGAR